MAAKTIPAIRIEGNVAYVPLTRGYEAIVCAYDVHLVDGLNWVAMVGKRAVYAVCYIKTGGETTAVLMHRKILSAPTGMKVDHVNGDGLDNRRANIRLATSAQNAHNQKMSSANRSGVKGVSWNKRAGKWIARVMKDGVHVYLGLFDDIGAAEIAVSKARDELHGPYARHA